MSADFAVKNDSSMNYLLQMQKYNDEIASQLEEERRVRLSEGSDIGLEPQSMFEKLLKDKMVLKTEMTAVAEENKQSSLNITTEKEKNIGATDWKVDERTKSVQDLEKSNSVYTELEKAEDNKISLTESSEQVNEVVVTGEHRKTEKTENKKVSLTELTEPVNEAVVTSSSVENLETELTEEQAKLLSFLKSENETVLSDKKSNKNKNVAEFSSSEKFNSIFGKNEDFPIDLGIPANEKGKIRKQKNKQEIIKIIDLRKNDAGNAGAVGEQSTDIAIEQKSATSDNTVNTTNKNFQFADSGEGGRAFQFNHASNTSGEATSSRPSSTVFQNMLLDNLKENGNTDIVKNARFVLKDSGAGEIKLILKPESLGYVRIMLTLEDNNIAGKIIVDNKSIKEVFENNMESLIRSFKENGFSEASLNVSVGIGAGTDNKGNDKSNPFKENRNIYAKTEIEKVDSQRTIRYGMEEEVLVDMVI